MGVKGTRKHEPATDVYNVLPTVRKIKQKARQNTRRRTSFRKLVYNRNAIYIQIRFII